MWSFYIMERERVLFKVEIGDKDVNVISYTDRVGDQQFPEDKVTFDDVYDWLEYRCFPRTRANCKELLKRMGLSAYDPLDIIHVTHGMLWDDYIWVKFEGEEIEYKDIKLRD